MSAGNKSSVGQSISASKYNQGFHKITWVIDSELAAGVVPNIQVPVTASHNIAEVHARVATPSAGAAIRLDILKNGTSIHSSDNDKCTIPAGQNAATTSTFNDNSLQHGDHLQLEIEQVGTTTKGTGLVCVVELE
jgi:hypothetical protein